MKTNFKNLVLLFLFVPLLSCSDELEVNPANQSSNFESSPKITLQKNIQEYKYVYKGETSILKYEVNGENAVLLEGKDNDKIEQVFNIPTLTTYIDLNNTYTIYLFDNYEEYEIATKHTLTDNSQIKENTSFNSRNFSSTSTANSTATCTSQLPGPLVGPYVITHYVRVFQDRDFNYNTGFLELNYKASDDNNYLYDLCLPDLTSVNGANWSDRITSLWIDNRCDGCNTTNTIRLELFEHVNYGGKALAISASPGFENYIASLSNYSMSTFSSWNDKASSLKVLHQYAY